MINDATAEFGREIMQDKYYLNEIIDTCKFVNAHINNISFPKTIDQLEEYIYERGGYNIEDVIAEAADGYTEWRVPRNSVVGDIVLYFHAKTAIQSIRKLETATKKLDPNNHDIDLIFEWLQRVRELYSKYGGKIFAVGRIDSKPELYDDIKAYHWTGRIYSRVRDLFLLERPIDISEFNSFILVSRQSAITKLPSKEFDRLRGIIIDQNKNLPSWFLESKIGEYNLSRINSNNFLEVTKYYRKRFLLEADFRSYYVDYFLRTISKKKFYRECQCHSAKTPLARVDNLFVFNGKIYLLEVKLNIRIEEGLIDQLNQYIMADYITIADQPGIIIDDYEKSYMFVIDVYAIYRYEVGYGKLIKLFELDELNNKEDIILQMQSAVI